MNKALCFIPCTILHSPLGPLPTLLCYIQAHLRIILYHDYIYIWLYTKCLLSTVFMSTVSIHPLSRPLRVGCGQLPKSLIFINSLSAHPYLPLYLTVYSQIANFTIIPFHSHLARFVSGGPVLWVPSVLFLTLFLFIHSHSLLQVKNSTIRVVRRTVLEFYSENPIIVI